MKRKKTHTHIISGQFTQNIKDSKLVANHIIQIIAGNIKCMFECINEVRRFNFTHFSTKKNHTQTEKQQPFKSSVSSSIA